MAKTGKRHLLREQPGWATGPGMTECGYSSAGVLSRSCTADEFRRHAYRRIEAATTDGWCETCLRTGNWRGGRTDAWTRRLESRSQTEQPRIAAEIVAVDIFAATYGEALTELVNAQLGVDSTQAEVPHQLACERNERGELHCTTGPAWAWYDGPTVYYLEGIIVPDWVVTDPDPTRFIRELTNAEQRRVAFAQYGWQRAASELGWQVIDDPGNPEIGVLYDLPTGLAVSVRGEQLNLLYVKNSSPHPGGEHQYYGLLVGKRHGTAAQAQAAGWGLSVEEWEAMEVQT